MGEVVVGLAVFAVVIAVGWGLVRFGAVPAGSDVVLTRVCFYAATPALLVTTVGDADLSTVLSRETLAGLLAETLGILTAGLVHRLVLHRSIAESTIGALAAGYVNAANLGIPVLVVLLGSATAIAPILLLQLLVLSPIAFAILDSTTAAGSGSRIGMLTAPLRNPLLLGVAVGLVVNLAHVHLENLLGGLVLSSLNEVAGLAVTLMMISLGMSLAASSKRVAWRLTVTQPRRLSDRRGAGAEAQPSGGTSSAVAPADGDGPRQTTQGEPRQTTQGEPRQPVVGDEARRPTQGEPREPRGTGTGTGTSTGTGAGTASRPPSRARAGLSSPLWVSVSWKLVLVPLLALAIGLLLGLRGAALLVPVTTASLPSAQNVFMYATRYEAAKDLARDCVLLTTAGFVPVVLLAAAVLA